jgi:peroxiredoxin
MPGSLPLESLPPPADDGASAHLAGARLPAIELPSTAGGPFRPSEVMKRAVMFVYTSIRTGDDPLLEEWTAIPGARGCTPEACAFRDQRGEFRAAGVDVLGLSGQSPVGQRDSVERLHLSYPLVSDERLQLAASPGLPTFDFRGTTYFKRVTLVVWEGTIEAALYPVFPPDRAADQALAWLAENPR